jgi:hypothetical protein
MNHWPFIIGAYALSLTGTLGLLAWSFLTMRRAEKAAEELSRRP